MSLLLVFGVVCLSFQPKLPLTKIPSGAWLRFPEGDPDTTAAWLYYRPASFNFHDKSSKRLGFEVYQNGKIAFFSNQARFPKDTIWSTWRISKPGRIEISNGPSTLKNMEWLWKESDLIFVRFF